MSLPLEKSDVFQTGNLNKEYYKKETIPYKKGIIKQRTLDIYTRKQMISSRKNIQITLEDHIPVNKKDDKKDYKSLPNSNNHNKNENFYKILFLFNKKVNSILDSYYYIIILTILSFYTLFIPDIKTICIYKQNDYIIFITLTICFVIFLFEIVFSSVSVKNYLFSFFFWLDLISTISILQDIDFIFIPIISLFVPLYSKNDALTYIKTFSTRKITKIIRIIRILRLIRITKLYKSITQARNYIEKNKLRKSIKKMDIKKGKEKEEMKKIEKAIEIYEKSRKEWNKNEDSKGFSSRSDSIQKDESHSHCYNQEGNNLNDAYTDKKLIKYIDTQNNDINKNTKEYLNLNNNIEKSDMKFKSFNKLNLVENQDKLGLNKIVPIELTKKESDKSNKKESKLTLLYKLNLIENASIEKKEEKIQDLIKESQISKMISESSTKTLIVLILGMILGLQIINEDNYIDNSRTYDSLLLYFFSNNITLNLSNLNYFYASEKYPDFSLFKTDFYNSSFSNTSLKSIYDENRKLFLDKYNYSQDFQVIFNNFTEKSKISNISSLSTVPNTNQSLSYILLKLASFELDDSPFPLINITYNHEILYINKSLSEYPYRSEEVNIIEIKTDNANVTIYKSLIYDSQLSASLNIGMTIFIITLIVIGALDSEKKTKTMLMNPLEAMMEIVEMVEENPIIAKNSEELTKGIKQMVMDHEINIKKGKKKIKKKEKHRHMNMMDNYEVIKIKNSIIKISALLAICFGDAGADVIRQNLEKGKDFNPMLEGKKKNAIFGFCDIRYFPYVNDALQERTMIFLNQISEIVHSSIDRFSGSTNKNIGDSYLSAWRFSETYKDEDNKVKTREIELDMNNSKVNSIADQSILGFLQILLEINTDSEILAYRKDPSILLHPELSNYKVKMGFGLHVGWGIEGAIGSNNKIDASYLSPNVNISARLKEATKQYKVYILISGELYRLCSQRVKDICRLIDKVEVKGSLKPIELYTIDVNVNLQRVNNNKSSSSKKRYDKLIKIKNYIIKESKGDIVGYTLNSKGFKNLLNMNRHKDFLVNFNNGIINYLQGDWLKAKESLLICRRYDENDGPTKVIYEYMENYNFDSSQTETSWKGYRSLTSK